jgi:spermidine/putrescine ABC transporter ATP-binding subunit
MDPSPGIARRDVDSRNDAIMSTGQTLISLQGVSKRFGGVNAVVGVSFEVGAGEFFSLLGPSGCGKTTLLRILAGFEVPTSGEVIIDGQPMSAVPPNRRPTNMVFQNYAIFPHLDVRQNIAYGLRNQGLRRDQIDREVEAALRLIKLPGHGGRRANQLSGGERQRVALARALVCKPKVLLLDEPLGALDKKLREEMQLELRQLQRSVGITFVFVTHDQEEALTMSDRVAVMSKGRILQIDDAERLYEAPNCREVAAFIGTMNFLPGRLLRVEGAIALIDAAGLGKLRARTEQGRGALPATVTLAVRPEKIQIAERPFSEPGFNSFKGRVVERAYLGDRNHYYIEVAGLRGRMAVAEQNVLRSFGGERIVGREVHIGWRADAGVVLPGDDEGGAWQSIPIPARESLAFAR